MVIRGDIMREWKTSLLLLAVILLVAIMVNYFISMRIYSHWQFSDVYKDIYFWIFIGATIFFRVLVFAISNYCKRNSAHKKD